VRDAAKEQTQTTARPLIQTAVASQVKARVDEEQGTIRHTVTEQTQAAVKQMGTQIDKLVKDSVDAKVQTQLAPVENQVNSLKTYLDLQRLIARMNADDAQAFDALMRMPPNTLQPDEQQLLISSLRTLFLSRNEGFFTTRQFNTQLSDDELVGKLSS